jgi:uncharacterized membrane protein required for colicin V production
MSFFETSFYVLAAIALLHRGWSGCCHGATVEVRYLLTILFAVLVAARYWQPLTEWLSASLTFDPRFIALGVFVVLLGIGGSIAGFVVKIRGEVYRSEQINYLDHALGLVAGLFSGALLAACLLWFSAVAHPVQGESSPLVNGFVDLPRNLVGCIETSVGVAPDSTARTRFPVVTMDEMPAGDEGSKPMQGRSRISWK